ncbi:hypothetical protein RMN57_33195 [Kitasatospora sp. CM 4170]|uniref:Lipoprotein n=1 Tax=Kitasatospora aburaviensis TaxID=67265 RepID=A0ABW1F749_9ACTN|nr:hypothetical protein [Kitasatospora sp. CM 4170]WNM49205.1 hypothetical protein RMN57_33195 [Kitasatospora sp. CM 4170]
MPKFTGSRRLLAATGLAAVLLAATACGPGEENSTDTAATAAAPAAAAGTSAPGAAGAADAAGGGRLAAAESPTLGAIVTDGSGRTLYRFDKDTAKPSATTCVDACAAKWPPVPAQDKVDVTGVESALVGSVTRPDGSKQLTLNGWPLYRFAGDTAPGQTNGQGVGGTWFASTPEGKKAAAGGAAGGAATGQTGAPAPSASKPQTGGYPSGY